MSNITRRGAFILPGICSIFIPGLGQLFKGQIGKAIGMFVIIGVLGWLGKYFLLFGIVAGIAWLINVIDAFFAQKQ